MFFRATGFPSAAAASAAALEGVERIKAQLAKAAATALSGVEGASAGAAPSVTGTAIAASPAGVVGYSRVDVEIRDAMGQSLGQQWVLPTSDAPLPRASRANVIVMLPAVPTSMLTVYPSVPQIVPCQGNRISPRAACTRDVSVERASFTLPVTDTSRFDATGQGYLAFRRIIRNALSTQYARFTYRGKTPTTLEQVQIDVDLSEHPTFIERDFGVYASVQIPAGTILTVTGTTKQFVTSAPQWIDDDMVGILWTDASGATRGEFSVSAHLVGRLHVEEVDPADRTESPVLFGYTLSNPPFGVDRSQAAGNVIAWKASGVLLGAHLKDPQGVEYITVSGGAISVGGSVVGRPHEAGDEAVEVGFVSMAGPPAINPGTKLAFVDPPAGVRRIAIAKTIERETVVPAGSTLTARTTGKRYRTRTAAQGVGGRKIPIEALLLENASDLKGSEVLTWDAPPRGTAATSAVADVEQAIAYPHVETPAVVVGTEVQLEVDVRREHDGTYTALVGTRPLGS